VVDPAWPTFHSLSKPRCWHCCVVPSVVSKQLLPLPSARPRMSMSVFAIGVFPLALALSAKIGGRV